MTRRANYVKDVAIVAGVSLLTNFLYVHFAAADYFFPDSFTYLGPARTLLQGLGFLTPAGLPDTLRTPGYPLLLAAFGTRIVPVIVTQHLMNVLMAVTLYLVAARRLGRFVGMTAGLLFAVDTPTIHYANKILTETLCAFVLLIVFVLVLERRALPLAGLLTGALVLIRPVAIAYFLVVAAYLLLRRVRVRDVVIYTVAALALPCAWATRNFFGTGVFTVSSIGGTNMIVCRAPGVLAILDDGENFEADMAAEADGLLADADVEIQQTLNIPDAGELPDAVRARYYSRIGLRIIRQHPLAFAELTLRGLLVNVFESDWDAMSTVSRLHESIVHMALDAYTAAMFIFAVIGLFALRRDDIGILTGLTVAYFLFMAAGGVDGARYRVPVVPEYAIAAAAGIDVIRRVATRPPATSGTRSSS